MLWLQVLAKMHAAGLKHNEGVPVVDPFGDWHTADGFIFAFPTRYGSMPAQVRACLCACVQPFAAMLFSHHSTSTGACDANFTTS